jgi:hypothetical protein
MLVLLCISLPALNWERCDEPGIGYTCADLASGVARLGALLERRAPAHRLTFHVYSAQLGNQLLLRTMAVALSLATNSTPVLLSTQTIGADPAVAGPSFAAWRAKPALYPPFEALPPCFDEARLPGDASFVTDPLRFADLLFNPAVARVARLLGPAALHILVHLALNITAPAPRTGAALALGGAPCLPGAAPAPERVLPIVRSADLAFALGDYRAWVLSLARGLPPLLHDRVSGACFRAHSFLAGGVNPLYAGVYRSESDLADANVFCGTHEMTRDFLRNAL